MKEKTFFQNPLYATIKNYFETEGTKTSTIFIYVPFIKTEVLQKLLQNVDLKVVIITTWDTRDLLMGSSELELYPFCKAKGISLYVNNRIHLKVYSVGFESMISASGNISQRGLLLDGNYEIGVLVNKLSISDRLYFEKIRKEARLVNDKFYQQLLEWFEKQKKQPQEQNKFDSLVSPPSDDDFLISALPMTKDVLELVEGYMKLNSEIEPSSDEETTSCIFHDLANYDIPLGLSQAEFLNLLKIKFFEHPFIKRIDQFLNPSAQFGQIKEWVQNNCHDVPIPSRRELTGNVQVLFEWFEKLGDGKYIIDVPGTYSQRLTKVIQSEQGIAKEIQKMVWIGLNEKGKSIDQIEKDKKKKYQGDLDQEEFRAQAIWHNKTDIDLYVAKKLNINPDKWGKDLSKNYFYKTVVNAISKLRKEGKIVDWKHYSDQELDRTGIWRLR